MARAKRSRSPAATPSTRFIAGDPMNAATNRFTGRSVEHLRQVALLDDAVVQHHDAVAERHRLDLVVGDVTVVTWRRSWSRASSERIDVRSLASRFESGSSSRNASGSRTSARPIATRWRWPPESCARPALQQLARGRACRRRRATRRVDLRRARCLRWRSPNAEVLAHRHVRVQRVVLEDHRDVAVRWRDAVTSRSPMEIVAARSPARARRSAAAAWTSRSPRGRRARRTRRRRSRARRRGRRPRRRRRSCSQPLRALIAPISPSPPIEVERADERALGGEEGEQHRQHGGSTLAAMIADQSVRCGS